MRAKLHDKYRNRIIEEAAEWFARLQDPEVGVEDRGAFAAWLMASAEHVHEYLALIGLQTDIRGLEAASSPALLELASLPIDGLVVPLQSTATDLTGFSRVGNARAARRVRQWLALAASMAAIAIGCVWWWPDADTALYTTAIGEQKSVTLPDGSVLTLNTVSRLRVRYVVSHRDIELLSGEALFTVAKDPNRPFRVITDDTLVQAVGTRFNVRHRDADTTITVIEGRVKVASSSLPAPGAQSAGGSAGTAHAATRNTGDWVPLTAGQRAHVGAPGVIDVSSVDAAADTAWPDRRLIFESRPLGEVVAEFNLYNETPIEIRDPALLSTRVSGSFYANNTSSFLLFLAEAQLARAEKRDDAILLVPAR